MLKKLRHRPYLCRFNILEVISAGRCSQAPNGIPADNAQCATAIGQAASPAHVSHTRVTRITDPGGSSGPYIAPQRGPPQLHGKGSTWHRRGFIRLFRQGRSLTIIESSKKSAWAGWVLFTERTMNAATVKLRSECSLKVLLPTTLAGSVPRT